MTTKENLCAIVYEYIKTHQRHRHYANYLLHRFLFDCTFKILPELIIGGVNVMRAIDHKRGMGKSCKTTGSIPKVQ